MRRSNWAAAAAAGALASAWTASALAQASGGKREQPHTVEEVVVTATRTEKTEATAPATVSVIVAREIEDQLAVDIKDLVQREPGVSVRSSPARYGAAFGSTGRDGNAGFNIRGLEGNRVLIQVDGVRVPDSFVFGPQAVGRGDYADLDLLKSVEIIRGPASALYGSDGLAGAVSFITKDPHDFLVGRSAGGRGRIAYASADNSWSEGLAAAGGSGAVSGLLAYTHREGREQETQGRDTAEDSTRTAANPQSVTSDAVLGKLVFEPSAAHRLRLTYDRVQREVTTEVLSGRAPPPLRPTSVVDLDARDQVARSRWAVDYRYEGPGPIARASIALYAQESETVQLTLEDRNTALDRTRRNTFDNSVRGVSVQGETAAQLGGIEHRFVYGADASWTRQEGVRDGAVPPVGERFPTRAFPNTDYRLVGAFVQDELRLLDGALSLYPGIRYDSYQLDPKADALFPHMAKSSNGSRLSPKFAAVWFPIETLGFFFNYTQGFKAPSPLQVNNGFANPVANYVSLPNPALKPETSRSFEGGVRLRDAPAFGATWRGSIAVFAAAYENFIEQVQVGGSFTPTDPAVFQYVNLTEVDIDGVEARAEGRWSSGAGVMLAASSTRGDQRPGGGSGEVPLASIDPLKVIAVLSWREPSADRWGGALATTFSAAKQEDRVGLSCPGGCYTPDAFLLVDVTAYWRLSERAVLRAGVFNITDERYSWWSDVRGLSATSSVLDAYTQPGRNVAVSLALNF